MTSLFPPVTTVVLLCLLLHPTDGTCPSICLCTSDTLSCGSQGLTRLPLLLHHTTATLDLSYNRLGWIGPGSFSSLPRLDTLRLVNNQLSTIGHGAFHNASSLRHLDLSSNSLQVMEQHCLQGLCRLEELLGLSSLRKVYFSLNQITEFPFFSIQDHMQKGLYLHNNSLVCEFSMYGVFWHWEQRGFDSVWEFTEENTCLIYGEPRASVQILQHSRYFQNCTVGKVVSLPVAVLISNLMVYEGERVQLDCQTSLQGKELSYMWVSPNQEHLTWTSFNDTLINVFPNGTLEIPAAKVNDTGVYVCTTRDNKHMLNATREVNVTVVSAMPYSFSTSYTTLLGCVVSLVVILMCLYLTPCRCGCCKQPQAIPIPANNPGTLASIFSPTLSNKHMGFMEPMLEDQNRGLRVALATEQSTLQWEWDTSGLT
uniref:Adhesion molecule with Ig like domain 3 n=1 Tax=Oncorhynchus kisutch TaxID=8019 RepID=A0A8C7I9P9_ONCKI